MLQSCGAPHQIGMIDIGDDIFMVHAPLADYSEAQNKDEGDRGEAEKIAVACPNSARTDVMTSVYIWR